MAEKIFWTVVGVGVVTVIVLAVLCVLEARGGASSATPGLPPAYAFDHGSERT
jgi:hypothetical protein